MCWMNKWILWKPSIVDLTHRIAESSWGKARPGYAGPSGSKMLIKSKRIKTNTKYGCTRYCVGNQIQLQWKFQWSAYNIGSTYTVSHCDAKKPQHNMLLYSSLCHSKSSCPGQPIVLLFSALPLSSQRVKWKGHWIASQKTRVLTPVACPWASYLQSLRWPSLIFTTWPVGYVMASTLSHSDMPSLLSFSHQPMITSHLGSFFSFSSFASLDLYFGTAVRAQFSLPLSEPQQSIWTPSHSCL